MSPVNPFALVHASHYTDQQVNDLWVEIGLSTIDDIIEPRSRISKFILGGKGTGKTHILRYYSYPATRLRGPMLSGIQTVERHKFLAVFLRATGIDAARFESTSGVTAGWQQLFGVYLELKFAEAALDALQDIKVTSANERFDDAAFVGELSNVIVGDDLIACASIEDFRAWVIRKRREIDAAVNNSAFSGRLEIRVPFSIGALCPTIGRAIARWHTSLAKIPMIYLLDEIENFSERQQQVVNTLIRYGEGLSTFRVTGRLYALRTKSTISDGEENREGSEFKTTVLDEILLKFPKYPDFAKRFIVSRLAQAGLIPLEEAKSRVAFDPAQRFENLPSANFYRDAIAALNISAQEAGQVKSFVDAAVNAGDPGISVDIRPTEIADLLTARIPLMLQKLNILLFYKRHVAKRDGRILARRLREQCLEFFGAPLSGRNGTYSVDYNHWSADLFAQLCRDARRQSPVPYAGFDTLVRMSSSNPRNLLIILDRIYSIAKFKGVDFVRGGQISSLLQTEAVVEAARFIYESDSNFGGQSDQARAAIERLAILLRTARYSANIPEVSPLAISFSDSYLSVGSRQILNSALNYSMVFELSGGRPDRNSQEVRRKIRLNPMLAPRWGLPIGHRGDLSIGPDLLNAIFEDNRREQFDVLLRAHSLKWRFPLQRAQMDSEQGSLF